MDSNNKSTRRRFLKSALAAGVGMTIVPRHVLGGNGFIAPSDQLTKLYPESGVAEILT
ncbi:MAG: twin-arginine translocation signal domain-containing protein [Prolixibacteraceae bacterium]|nr:twin-arginine translocation signal domain-containing protein [Prolixibacteraceae bacterium]